MLLYFHSILFDCSKNESLLQDGFKITLIMLNQRH